MNEVFSKPKKLVIIPQWLLNTLRSNNLALTYALDIHALRRIISLNSVAFYTAVNTYLYDSLPEGIKGTFNPVQLLDPLPYMMQDNAGYYPEEKDVLETARVVGNLLSGEYSINERKPTIQHVLDIMPHYELKPMAEGSLTERDLNFTMEMIEDDVFGIMFTLKDNKTSSLQQTIQSYDSVLTLLIANYGLNEVAKTAAFKTYCDLTRKIEV